MISNTLRPCRFYLLADFLLDPDALILFLVPLIPSRPSLSPSGRGRVKIRHEKE